MMNNHLPIDVMLVDKLRYKVSISSFIFLYFIVFDVEVIAVTSLGLWIQSASSQDIIGNSSTGP